MMCGLQNPKARTGRLAPSPTGALHLGNVRTFLIAWLQMRAVGGSVRLRIEDLDHPKHKAGAAAALISDLQWLGFDWDGDIVFQSDRRAVYLETLNRLRPRLYPCFCSRADIATAQSAPHPGEILRYPGFCRNLSAQEAARRTAEAVRPPAWRFAVNPDEPVAFTELFSREKVLQPAESTGDFIVARGEEAAYALAVVVDDAAMGVTDVVRGEDILQATPAQVLLYRTLGLEPPRFCHVPLVTGPDGRRLAKRHGDTRLQRYRQAGMARSRILAALARSCGWPVPERLETAADLIPGFTVETIPHAPFVWSDMLL